MRRLLPMQPGATQRVVVMSTRSSQALPDRWHGDGPGVALMAAAVQASRYSRAP
jgi:hypothetical protein